MSDWKQRNHKFSKSMADAQFTYIEAEIENAKLQKLVQDILHWMPCHRPCGKCERYEYPNGCEFERRGRELGIEVDKC